MNKKLFLAFGIPLFVIATVLAGVFYFSSFNFTFGVSEPLDVKYAGIFNSPVNCDTWSNFNEFNGTVNFPSLYPGDYGKICFVFTSSASEPLPLSYELSGDWDNMFSSYNVVIPNDTSITFSRGYVDFTVKPDANGKFNGQINFGRG